jgi:hypothetical protein
VPLSLPEGVVWVGGWAQYGCLVLDTHIEQKPALKCGN